MNSELADAVPRWRVNHQKEVPVGVARKIPESLHHGLSRDRRPQCGHRTWHQLLPMIGEAKETINSSSGAKSMESEVRSGS
jgi:hypothetical protein